MGLEGLGESMAPAAGQLALLGASRLPCDHSPSTGRCWRWGPTSSSHPAPNLHRTPSARSPPRAKQIRSPPSTPPLPSFVSYLLFSPRVWGGSKAEQEEGRRHPEVPGLLSWIFQSTGSPDTAGMGHCCRVCPCLVQGGLGRL